MSEYCERCAELIKAGVTCPCPDCDTPAPVEAERISEKEIQSNISFFRDNPSYLDNVRRDLIAIIKQQQKDLSGLRKQEITNEEMFQHTIDQLGMEMDELKAESLKWLTEFKRSQEYNLANFKNIVPADMGIGDQIARRTQENIDGLNEFITKLQAQGR